MLQQTDKYRRAMHKVNKIVIGLFLITLGSTVSADMQILCQSELLKKKIDDPWSAAVFYDGEAFVLELLNESKATLRESSFGNVNCATTSTKITCMYNSKGVSSMWSINRLNGIYESYASSRPNVESKVRGLCKEKSRRLF